MSLLRELRAPQMTSLPYANRPPCERQRRGSSPCIQGATPQNAARNEGHRPTETLYARRRMGHYTRRQRVETPVFDFCPNIWPKQGRKIL